MPGGDAGLLAGILTRNNRRCIYSHGTGQVPYYLQKIKDGDINPRPRIATVSEAPGALVMDGDGGLGYFPCWHGTRRIIEKARTGGVAVLTTRNHQHFGSAGNYTRLAIEQDCIGLGGFSASLLPRPGTDGCRNRRSFSDQHRDSRGGAAARHHGYGRRPPVFR